MEIKAQSIHNRETINKYAKTNLKQKLPLFLAIDFLYFLIVLSSTRSFTRALIEFIIMTIVIALILSITIKRQFKTLDKFQKATYEYLFRDNDFTCSIKTTDGKYYAQSVISYTFPVKAIETDFYLYIYTAKALHTL